MLTPSDVSLIDLTDSDQPSPPHTGTMLNIPQVADRLGIGVRYVRRLVAERRIPFYKVGYLIRFDSQEVESWLRASRVDHGG